MCKENIELTNKIIKDVKKEYPQILIYCWTGYNFEDIVEKYSYVLENVDILIDGRFILEQRDITLKLRGSSNQRVIDVQKTLLKGDIVLWN